MSIETDIIYNWEQNHKITMYLLNNVKDEWLPIKLGNKGRSIGEQFVHINNIRSFWISKVGEKVDLKIDMKHAAQRQRIIDSLELSSLKMGTLFSQLFKQESIKGFKPHATAFFTQMIAHESHHRGQIMATITRNDLEIDKSVNFGLWSWNNK